MNTKPAIFYIQAARGVAVLLVMLFHASRIGQKYFNYNFMGLAEYGRSGAYTFFFVLTGYLMYTLYHKHFGDSSMLKSFLYKRFARIYPVYWLITLVVIPIYFLVPSFGEGFERKPSVIVESLLLLPQATGPILSVAWSVTYIVWFYLMFSLLFLISEKAVAAVYSSWITVIVLHMLGWLHIRDGVWGQFLVSEFHLEFFAGIAVGYIVRKRKSLGNNMAWILSGGAAYVVLWLIRYRNAVIPYVDLLHMVGSVLILVGIVTWRGKIHEWLTPLKHCGDASYSILLASLPAMSVIYKLERGLHIPDHLGLPLTVTICFLTGLGVCLLFYRWIEQPINTFLKKREPARARRIETRIA
ncbi:acyltransferase family protein [Paenibacillus thalictri]|uniref:Acyltransferase n=1 Tax=Paenibacillus thalictri TaxID=2527873 RepID=A0A4Q9DH49_9BACL|nr:acyltransferase [Paenibacillus thalictri]TBL70741.1 acyltransferase [Paenibacillus thalictri]